MCKLWYGSAATPLDYYTTWAFHRRRCSTIESHEMPQMASLDPERGQRAYCAFGANTGQCGQVGQSSGPRRRFPTDPSPSKRPSSVTFAWSSPRDLFNLDGILSTERPGRLRLVRSGVPRAAPIAGLPPIHAQGIGGLMDAALRPPRATRRPEPPARSRSAGDAGRERPSRILKISFSRCGPMCRRDPQRATACLRMAVLNRDCKGADRQIRRRPVGCKMIETKLERPACPCDER